MSCRAVVIGRFSSVTLSTRNIRFSRSASVLFSSAPVQKQKRRSKGHLKRMEERLSNNEINIPSIASTKTTITTGFPTTASAVAVAAPPIAPDAQRQHRRRAAAQAVAPWLKRDADWRQETMNALQLPTTAMSRIAASPNKKGRHHPQQQQNPRAALVLWDDSYRHLYKDSLPSFLELLLQQPPSELHTALDQLADAGFDNPTFTKSFRRRMADLQDAQLLIGKSTANQLRMERELVAKRKKHKSAIRDMAKLETRHAKLVAKRRKEEEQLEAQKKAEDNESNSLWNSTVQVASSWLFPSTSTKGADDDSCSQVDSSKTHTTTRRTKEHRNFQALEKKIQRKKTEIEAQEQAISNRELKLEKIKIELEMLSSHLDTSKDDAIHAVVRSVREAFCSSFADHIQKRHSERLEKYKDLDAKTDLTHPYEWFLFARLDRRKIIFHGGPTNSGKTYAALERLKEAERGVYLGPLRLLAAEVYERLTMDGIYCNLLTGQERREIPFATHSAATIEMASLEDEYDVAVIDEIQMVADDERGFAWTRALMGIRSKEIHVCGGNEAKKIVRRIARACGDEFESRCYDRFTELQVAPSSLAHKTEQSGSYKSVQPGDCVVAFSRNDIFAIKREIECTTNHKCCVIYGSLPPQTRSEQARLFNDPNSGYDVLVASDAIGMGLNLSIRRIIFNSVYKNNGSGIVRLDHSAMKQISGRAGRRNSPFPEGEVTCRDPQDMPHLRKCMATEIDEIRRAGLVPTASHIELFNDTLEKFDLTSGPGNLHEILLQFNDMATVKSDYFLCRQTPMVVIAKHIAPLDLSIRDKYTLCMCPVVLNSKASMNVLLRFAIKLATGEVSGLTRDMVPRRPRTFDELARLCSVFNELELFLWLQKKFPPGNMMEEQAALARKEKTIELIGDALAESDKLKLDHCYVSRDRRLRQVWENRRDRHDTNDFG